MWAEGSASNTEFVDNTGLRRFQVQNGAVRHSRRWREAGAWLALRGWQPWHGRNCSDWQKVQQTSTWH